MQISDKVFVGKNKKEREAWHLREVLSAGSEEINGLCKEAFVAR